MRIGHRDFRLVQEIGHPRLETGARVLLGLDFSLVVIEFLLILTILNLQLDIFRFWLTVFNLID